MTTPFALTRDINGYNGFGIKFSDTNYSATLATGTNTTLTVPSLSPPGGASYSGSANPILIALFEYDSGTSVWVSLNATAATPAGASFAATNSQLNPSARQVKAGDVLNFITAGTGVNVSVCFYWIGQ